MYYNADLFSQSAGSTARDDIRATASHGRRSADGLHDVLLFVVATIRTPIYRVGPKLDAIRRGQWHGMQNRVATRRAAEYVAANVHDIYRRLQRCDTRVDAVELFTEVPGLDTVKAGFVAQLLGYDVGCLDVHNLERFGLSRDAFRVYGVRSRERVRERIAHYVDVCDRCGGSLALWASWCDLIAARYRRQFDGGATVSRLHVTLCRATLG